MNTLPTLYKKTKTGAIEEWRISYDDGSYTIEHGQVDGAKQEKTNRVSGKNVGKANETSDLEQAESEAKSRWKKQKDKGYSENIKDLSFKIPKPMLAHEFKKYKDKITYPCYVQPKLDGVRCLAYLKDDKVILLSRQGKEYSVPHIQAALLPILQENPCAIFDGELYIHGVPFQSLVSWVKKAQTDTARVEYHIYDSIADEDFNTRFGNAVCILEELDIKQKVHTVNTLDADVEDKISEFHLGFVKLGYEGSIIRYGSIGYEAGYRSQHLLKLKDFITEEFEIVGATQDEHKPDECTFVLKTKDGTEFRCKPEGSQQFREQLWSDYQDSPESFHGQLMTVRYFELTTSDNPVPRFPVGVEIRSYE